MSVLGLGRSPRYLAVAITSGHNTAQGPGQGGNTIYYLLIVMVHTTVDNWSSVQTKSANQINEI